MIPYAILGIKCAAPLWWTTIRPNLALGIRRKRRARLRVNATLFPRIHAPPSRTTHLTWTVLMLMAWRVELGVDTSPQHATTMPPL